MLIGLASYDDYFLFSFLIDDWMMMMGDGGGGKGKDDMKITPRSPALNMVWVGNPFFDG